MIHERILWMRYDGNSRNSSYTWTKLMWFMTMTCGRQVLSPYWLWPWSLLVDYALYLLFLVTTFYNNVFSWLGLCPLRCSSLESWLPIIIPHVHMSIHLLFFVLSIFSVCIACASTTYLKHIQIRQTCVMFLHLMNCGPHPMWCIPPLDMCMWLAMQWNTCGIKSIYGMRSFLHMFKQVPCDLGIHDLCKTWLPFTKHIIWISLEICVHYINHKIPRYGLWCTLFCYCNSLLRECYHVSCEW